MSTARLAAVAVLLFSAAPIWADEAEDVFNSLYGSEYQKAVASRDTTDDAALAAKFLEAAKTKGTVAPLAALLCEKAYELGLKAPAGYETAAEAMELLAEKAPDRKAACLEKIITLRQKQYDAAKGLDKTTAGEVFIEAVLAAADAKGEAHAAAEASALLKRAMTMATALKSDRKAEIQARIDLFAARLRAEKRVGDLEAKLAGGPQGAATRKELVRLCLVELDDPAQAATFLDETREESMRKYVPAVSKGVDAAPEIACMELGEWYRGLAESASTLFKEPLMRRARAYYERFLKLHTAEDLQRNQAALALKKADEAMAKLAVRGSGVIGPGRWIDLLKLVDLEKDVMKAKGIWTFKDGELVISSNGFDRLAIPISPTGSYQLRGRFIRNTLDFPHWFVLPVGSAGVAVSFGRGEYGALMRASGKPDTGSPQKVINGQEYLVEITVLLSGNQADIRVALNGKPHLHWQGPVSDLSVADECRVPDPKCVALGVEWGDYVFKSAQLRMLSGKAKMLR
jgi:hypothetical protein